MDGPLFDGNIGEPLSQRLGGLLRAQEWRGDEECRFAVEAFGKVSGLRAAELSQGIADVVCGFAAGVGEALDRGERE